MNDFYWYLVDVIKAVGEARTKQADDVAQLDRIVKNRLNLSEEEQTKLVREYLSHKHRLEELDKALELMQQASEYL